MHDFKTTPTLIQDSVHAQDQIQASGRTWCSSDAQGNVLNDGPGQTMKVQTQICYIYLLQWSFALFQEELDPYLGAGWRWTCETCLKIVWTCLHAARSLVVAVAAVLVPNLLVCQ